MSFDGPFGTPYCAGHLLVGVAANDKVEHLSLAWRQSPETGAPEVQELCAEQIAMAGKPVTHTVTCDEIFLELDQTVSVALIVSELVTNCLKHAFKDGSQGHIANHAPGAAATHECAEAIGLPRSWGYGLGKKDHAGTPQRRFGHESQSGRIEL
jgi:hypothetical protein